MHELLAGRNFPGPDSTKIQNNAWGNLKTKKFYFCTCCKSKKMLKSYSRLFTLSTTFSVTCYKMMVKSDKLQLYHWKESFAILRNNLIHKNEFVGNVDISQNRRTMPQKLKNLKKKFKIKKFIKKYLEISRKYIQKN